MIRADRSTVAPPESLSRPFQSGANKGMTEEQAIIDRYAAYLAQADPKPKFSFPFAAYKSQDVKLALAQLFHGKCAYCESRYAGTQPMDVEHFRPKGGVQDVDAQGKPVLSDGYPWLAARWANLLPSCIDCNRPRTQHDALTGLDETLGKANQFPVAGPRLQPPAPGSPAPTVMDEALIIDPTLDDPFEHLVFRSDGIVTATTEKGRQSIRVYALNRAELVLERLGLARLIEQRLTIIEALARIVADPTLPDPIRLDLEDLVSHEIDALMALTEPGRAFSAMARRIVAENGPAVLDPGSAPAPWGPQVEAVLVRLGGGASDPRHVGLARRLAELGFAPQVPATSPYVRWTVAGAVRPVTLYQESSGLASISTGQQAFALTLPGALVPSTERPVVRFPYTGPSPDALLAVAARFRHWADGDAG